MKFKLCLIALALVVTVQTAQAKEVVQSTVTTTVTQESDAGPTTDLASRSEDIYASTSKGPYYYESTAELKARKLARGVANVTLCVAEIPNQMFLEAYRTSPVTGAVVGVWKGVKKGASRLAIGTWEIVTFYHPGKNHYQPYIEPEVVFGEYLH